MVNRKDIRDLNEQIQKLIEAVDELEDLYEQSQRNGVTVDNSAFESAQSEVKDAVSNLAYYSDDMVDRTGTLEDGEGNQIVDLPQAALNRNGKSRNLPE